MIHNMVLSKGLPTGISIHQHCSVVYCHFNGLVKRVDTEHIKIMTSPDRLSLFADLIGHVVWALNRYKTTFTISSYSTFEAPQMTFKDSQNMDEDGDECGPNCGQLALSQRFRVQ